MLTVVDTGPLYALFAADDKHHAICVDWLERQQAKLVVPAPIVTEVCYLLASRGGARIAATFCDVLAADDLFQVLAPLPEDYGRMAELMRQYENLPLDAGDASVIALAERLDVVTIATVDRRDFQVVRPRHVTAFTLVPELH